MDKIDENNISWLVSNKNYPKYEDIPFPHCVIDDFLVTETADKLYEDIKSLKLEDANSKYVNKGSPYEYNKFAFSEINKLPLALKNTFIYLNSKDFISQIEKITGINDIVYGDVNLKGAGVHVIKNNGYLKMHTDFNSYDHPSHGKLDRRINLLLYMNKDWKNEYNGDLLMYHPNNISDVKRIHPIFNRCVIFNTTKKSVHGHPEALCVPDDDLHRRSIAVYYYTKNYNKELDFEGDPEHTTIWHETPDSG